MDGKQKLEKARERVIEQISRNMNLYGITPSIGRLMGIMYFQNAPMTLDDMKDELGMSKTRMSSAIRTLNELKMVEKVWKKGERKDLYSVEEDWYESFINLFCINWRKGVSMYISSIHKSLAELNELIADDNVDEEVKAMAELDIKKLKEGLEYFHWLDRLIEAFESYKIFDYIPKTEKGFFDPK